MIKWWQSFHFCITLEKRSGQWKQKRHWGPRMFDPHKHWRREAYSQKFYFHLPLCVLVVWKWPGWPEYCIQSLICVTAFICMVNSKNNSPQSDNVLWEWKTAWGFLCLHVLESLRMTNRKRLSMELQKQGVTSLNISCLGNDTDLF